MTEPSIIERVARALHDQQDPIAYGWNELGEQHRIHLMDQARAAIASLREPTEGVRAAGADVFRERADVMDQGDRDSAEDVWRAMIDAALVE